MLGIIKQIFARPRPVSVSVDENIRHGALDAPRYPPTDQGIPLVKVEDVIESQREIVTRIQRTAGLTPENYATFVEPIITNFARYVLLLPATNTMNHRGAGGLFRMGLELGLFSLQVASSTAFSSKGSISAETRFRNHPKWVFATFVAAICSEIYRPISNMVVVDDEGKKWPQLLTPLYDWMVSNKKDRYYIVWNAQSDDEVGFQQANAAFLLTAIVPPASLQYLNDGDNEIMLAMTTCVTGAEGGNSQISKIVSSIRNKVVQNDMKTNSERYGMQIVGAHLEPHLLDAMRRLVKDGTWTVNLKGSRIWYSEYDGLFVVWQAAAREIVKLLEKDGRVGIPQDADTLADILIACGAAAQTDEGERFWSIQIPVSMQLLNAVRIPHPDIILQNSEIVPGEFRLLSGGDGFNVQQAPVKEAAVTESKSDPTGGLGESVQVDKAAGEITRSAEAPQENPARVTYGGKEDELASESSQEGKDAESAQARQPEQPSAPEPHLAAVAPKTDVRIKLGRPDGEAAVKPTATNKSASGAPRMTGQRMTAPRPQGDTQKSDGKAPAMFTPRAAGGVKEKVVPLGARADELFGALKADTREFLQTILEDCANKRSAGPVFCVPHGMAISTDELNAHGQVNYTILLQALSNKHWLWEDTENFPNGKKLHDVEHEGRMVRVMIIKPEIARGMGFDWKGA